MILWCLHRWTSLCDWNKEITILCWFFFLTTVMFTRVWLRNWTLSQRNYLIIFSSPNKSRHACKSSSKQQAFAYSIFHKQNRIEFWTNKYCYWYSTRFRSWAWLADLVVSIACTNVCSRCFIWIFIRVGQNLLMENWTTKIYRKTLTEFPILQERADCIHLKI